MVTWWHFQYIFQTDNSREIQTGWIQKKTQKQKQTNKQNTVHTVYANLPHIFGSCDIPLSPQKSRILILYTLRCCFWISLHKIVKKSSLTKHCNPLLPQNIPGLLEKWLENPTQILFSYQPIRCVDFFLITQNINWLLAFWVDKCDSMYPPYCVFFFEDIFFWYLWLRAKVKSENNFTVEEDGVFIIWHGDRQTY